MNVLLYQKMVIQTEPDSQQTVFPRWLDQLCGNKQYSSFPVFKSNVHIWSIIFTEYIGFTDIMCFVTDTLFVLFDKSMTYLVLVSAKTEWKIF